MQRSDIDIMQEKIFTGEQIVHHPPCPDIQKVNTVLFGNGIDGIAKIATEDHGYILGLKGSISVIKWGIGFVGFGQLVLISKAIFKW